NETYALRVAAHRRDVADGRAHERARRRDQHELVFRRDLQRTDETAVALRRLDRDDALPAAALQRELLDRRQLAVAVLGGDRDRAARQNAERDDLVALTRELEPADARGIAAHRPDVVLREADGLTGAREQHDVLRSVRDAGVDEPVVGTNVERDDAGRA